MIKNSKGYVLVETLIVTSFVAGVLIYLFVQLTNLNSNYEKTEKYNKVPNLYALIDVVYFIQKNAICFTNIKNLENTNNVIELNNSNCSGISNIKSLEKIEKLYACENVDSVDLSGLSEFDEFKNTIAWEGIESYRLIAKFKDGSYATFKF